MVNLIFVMIYCIVGMIAVVFLGFFVYLIFLLVVLIKDAILWVDKQVSPWKYRTEVNEGSEKTIISGIEEVKEAIWTSTWMNMISRW